MGIGNLVFHVACISSALGALAVGIATQRVFGSTALVFLILVLVSQIASYALGVILIYGGTRIQALTGGMEEKALLTLKFVLQGSATLWFPLAARGLLSLSIGGRERAILRSYLAAAGLFVVLYWVLTGLGERTVFFIGGIFSLVTYAVSLTYGISLPLRFSDRIPPQYRRTVRVLAIFFLVLIEAMIVQDIALILGAPLPQGILDGIAFLGLSLAVLIFCLVVLLSRAMAAGPLPGWREFGLAKGLTDRELDVLGGLMSGRTYKEIADRLSISQDTVKTHVGRIYRKSGVASRSQLRYLCGKDDLPRD